MSLENQTTAKEAAFKLRGEGRKLKDIPAELAKAGFKSNRGTPYSVASVTAMLNKQRSSNGVAKKMPARKAAAIKTGGSGVVNHVSAILDSRELPDATKLELLKKLLA